MSNQAVGSVKHWLVQSLVNMLGFGDIALPSVKQIVPNCLFSISPRQLELLLWRVSEQLNKFLLMFALNGIIE